MIITIDGPVASGKGTLAKALSEKLNILYIDSGAIYRVVAYFALEKGVDWRDEASVSAILEEAETDQISVKNGKNKIILNGGDISSSIRSSKISKGSSIVAQYPEVRNFSNKAQRKIAGSKDVVVEGRDTGSIVFPHADLKIFLTSDPKIRAERRLADYLSKSENKTFEEVYRETLERDKRDEERELAPLIKPEGAIVIDTTKMSVEQEVDMVLFELSKKELFEV